MARATIDVVNMYIGGAGLNGYTVISTSDVGVLNLDVTCVLEVDAVGVRAILRRRDRNVVDFDSIRIIELQMT
jgi:hypothetical protein